MKNVLPYAFLILAICSMSFSAPPSQVQQDLEKFIRIFSKTYPFFPEKELDWAAHTQQMRSQITPQSTRQDLVDLLCKTIPLLEDGHTTVWQNDSLLCYSPTPSQFLREFRGRYREFGLNAYRTLYQNGFDSIRYTDPQGVYSYSKNENFGYIRIRKFSVYPDHYKNWLTERRDRKTLEGKIDSILTAFDNTKGLILDVRSNPGGDYGNEIAGRFIQRAKISSYVSVRKKGGASDEFTRLKPEWVKPQGVRYPHPIVLLVNDQTASSAEEFVLALKNEQRVTILGTNTSGSLSDAIGRKLSNGLRFEYSTQRWYTPDTTLLEGRGILPDIYLENTRLDLEKQVDPLIKKALNLLST